MVEIVECMHKYVDRISKSLQSLGPSYPGPPTVFSFLLITVNKSNHWVSQYQQINQY